MPNRHAANWLLLATTLVISYHTQHIPVWLTLVTGCLVLWRYMVENHGWRPPGRILLFVLLAASVLLVYRQYGSLLGRDAGVGFLVLLCGLKLTELRKLRDYQFCVLLLYFLTLSAFLFSQSLLVGAYAAAVTTVTTMALIRLNHSQAVTAYDAYGYTFAILWRALPVMLIVYFLFPRVQGGLWGVPEDALGRTGLSDQIELGQILRLLGDDDVALRARFPGDPPANRDLYWRSFVLTETDGHIWRRPTNIRSTLAPEAFVPLGDTIEYEVTVEPHNQRWLVSLGLPQTAPVGTRLRGAHELESTRRLTRSFNYRLQSYLRYRTAPLDTREIARQLQLPPLDPRIEQMTERWRRLEDPEQIVASALHLFREQGFRYTLQPPDLGADPVADFLFRTKAGYCEHYAAAFVTLMRSAGVPSRIALGYQGGEMNPVGGYMMVRKSDAHAWAEVWLADKGWTRVDPTAAVAPERVELGINALLSLARQGQSIGTLPQDQIRRAMRPDWLRKQWRNLRLRWDAVNNAWDQWVRSYDSSAQLELMAWLGMQAPNWMKLVATAAIAVGLLLLVFAASLLNPRRQHDPVQRTYERYCAKLARRGVARAPHEGPLTFAQRVIQSHPELQQKVQAVTEVYIRLRYDRFDPAGLQALRQRVNSV